jgi:hypothetical protein
VDADRLRALRALPEEIINLLTKQEINDFLYKDVWPNSLKEKLKDYLE